MLRPGHAWIVALLGLLLYTSPALAQNGTITGVLVDSESGETLIGANVIIEGTAIGASTDIDGLYIIREVSAGTYTLQFTYIGYTPATVQNVVVTAGESTRIDLQLAPEAIGLDEVFVEARAIRNNEAVLLRDRQKAAAVSDAISSETITRSGSSNAADAMEKVTGASVVGGKYVYVRGLGDRYSNTTMNGVELPSADPDRKAVQFDLFPAALLDNVVTLKTFTPDKPGNFSGGLVDIGTKAYPEKLNVRFSMQLEANNQTNFNDNYLTYQGGDRDWLGTDDGTRAVPDPLRDPNIEIPSPQRARRDPELAQLLDQTSKSFNSTMAPVTGTPPLNGSWAVSVGNQTPVASRPLGFILSLSYKRKARFYENGELGRYSYTGSDLAPDLLLQDAAGVEEATWGGLANFNYKFSPNHEIGINTLYSRSGESGSRYLEGFWPKELGLDDTTSFFINRVLTYTERDLFTGQLHGKHYLSGLASSTLEWSVSGGKTSQEEPDVRFFANTARLIGDNIVYATRASGFSDPSRYYRALNENVRSGKLDLATPFKQWAGLGSSLKLGGYYQRTDRDFTERIFSFSPNQPFDGNDENYFAPENMGIIEIDTVRNRFTFGNVVRDATKMKNNYSGDQTIWASYAMLELPLSRKLKFIGGVRLESTDLEVLSLDSTQAIGKLDNLDWLPSANLVYALSPNMNLRAAATRTLARPTFREIAPFESFDFILSNFRIGNPALQRTLITNLDFRWEWFVRPGEILAFSVFYKDLENAIEQVIIGGTNGQLQYQNVPQARLLGLEVEARKRLDVVAALRNVSIGANLSLVDSKVDIAKTELEVRRAIDPEAPATRELQGQSPYTVNVDLSYDNVQTGSTASLFFNVFGRRLSNVSLGGTPDVFQRPSPRLDFTFIQRFGNDRWRLRFAVQNILNADIRETYRFDGQDYNYWQYKEGVTFKLGMQFTP